MADESLTHRARTREHARATDAAGSSAPEVEALLALFQPGEADQIVERVLRVVSQHLPFDWAGLVQRDGEVGSLLSAWTRRSDGTCAPDAAAIAEPRGAFDPPPSMTEGALPGDWGQPLTRHLFEKGLRRLLHAPLGGRPGSETFLLLAQRSEAPFRARGTGLVATLAAPLGAALEFAGRERELERRVEERTRELAILYDVSRTIGTTHRFEEMLQLVTGAVRSLLDADVVAVLVDLPGLRDFSLHLARPA